MSPPSSNMAETFDHRGVPASDDGGGQRDHPNFSDMFPSNFPEGLRVLVFDEDPMYLMILERHLQEFQYQVTTCSEEGEAMSLLRNRRNRFDIAMIQVNNSDGDRFRFISEIGSEMDLSIIIISKDDTVQSVIKWMSNGASDYLIKPIRPEDLRIIFKHVVKKMPGKRSVVTVESEEKAAGEKSSSVGDSNIRNPNKRKRSSCPNEEVNEEDHHDHDRVCASTSKKRRRVVWDGELHKKFVEAVKCLGPEKSVPKKILEIMNVENISRENVASHLQKFRMSLKKENDDKIKREEATNLSLITPQEGRMYVGGDASNFYRNVQFPTHHSNNINPQPSFVEQHTIFPNNFMPFLIPPHEHHCNEASIAVSGRNLVMNHQNQPHHQPHPQPQPQPHPHPQPQPQPHSHLPSSDFIFEENFGYNNFSEDESPIANIWSTPKKVTVFPSQEPPFEIRNNQEVGSLSHYTQNSVLDQQESGGPSYNSGCSKKNNRQT